MTKSKYSVVIPVYNSAKTVEDVIDQTKDFFIRHLWDYEIILINDGSNDRSWEKISKRASGDPNIVAIDLMKNYGQHSAIYCGFEYSTGEFIITIDDDLQNPPNEIIHLIEKINNGYDVVFGRYRQKKHSLVRRLGSYLIKLINEKIFNCPPNIVPTNFRIIHRDVVDRILDYHTVYPYITGLTILLSNNPANVWVEHRERTEGKSNYTFYKIIKLVSRILFNYSVWPLRLVSTIGTTISIFSFLWGIILIVNKLLDNVRIEGWTGIMVMLAFFNGIVIFILGMLGEYITRILQHVSSKKVYYIKKLVKYEN